MEGHGRRIYLEKNSRLFAQIMGESSPPRSLKHTWRQKKYATNWQFWKTQSRMGWQNVWIKPLSKLPGWCLSMQTCHTDFGPKPCPLLLSCETEALPKQSVGWPSWSVDQRKTTSWQTPSLQVSFVHIPKDDERKNWIQNPGSGIRNDHQRLSIVWSTEEGVSQQKCHFQWAKLWIQGALPGSGVTATCLPRTFRWTLWDHWAISTCSTMIWMWEETDRFLWFPV